MTQQNTIRHKQRKTIANIVFVVHVVFVDLNLKLQSRVRLQNLCRLWYLCGTTQARILMGVSLRLHSVRLSSVIP